MTPQVQHYQVQHYIEKLQDQDRGIRKEAIVALGQIGDVAAVPALIEMLQDEFMGVRVLAAIELGKLKDDSAVPGLIQALEDEEWIVREEAVAALWKLDDTAAVPALLKRLQDNVYQVQRPNHPPKLYCVGRLRRKGTPIPRSPAAWPGNGCSANVAHNRFCLCSLSG